MLEKHTICWFWTSRRNTVWDIYRGKIEDLLLYKRAAAMRRQTNGEVCLCSGWVSDLVPVAKPSFGGGKKNKSKAPGSFFCFIFTTMSWGRCCNSSHKAIIRILCSIWQTNLHGNFWRYTSLTCCHKCAMSVYAALSFSKWELIVGNFCRGAHLGWCTHVGWILGFWRTTVCPHSHTNSRLTAIFSTKHDIKP